MIPADPGPDAVFVATTRITVAPDAPVRDSTGAIVGAVTGAHIDPSRGIVVEMVLDGDDSEAWALGDTGRFSISPPPVFRSPPGTLAISRVNAQPAVDPAIIRQALRNHAGRNDHPHPAG